MQSCGLVVLRSCGLVVVQSCSRAVLLSCGHAVLLSCGRAVLLSCSRAVLLSCSRAVLLSCSRAVLLSCSRAVLLSCGRARGLGVGTFFNDENDGFRRITDNMLWIAKPSRFACLCGKGKIRNTKLMERRSCSPLRRMGIGCYFIKISISALSSGILVRIICQTSSASIPK